MGRDPFDEPVPGQCIHEVVGQVAGRLPERQAITGDGGGWTFSELTTRAHGVAHALADGGVRAGDLVAVSVERTPDLVPALLGILELGAAYVPIDAGYPEERVRFMMSDARVAALLTDSATRPRLPASTGSVVLVEDTGHAASAPPRSRPATGRDLAYAMYTSGSTGRPKCAGNTHAGIVNLIYAMARVPGLTPKDTVGALISLAHDMSVADLFGGLGNGALVSILPADAATSPERLAELLATNGVTYLSATPSTFRVLLDVGWQPARPMRVLMAGEALPAELVKPLVERGCEVWNGYGMTEASVYTTITRCWPGRPVTIGGALINTPVYLLGDNLQPVADGEAGELYHGGVGVGTGYLNRPELTPERFMPDPFSSVPGAMMYRSGDLARRDAEGALHYLGRADRQVKIRGFRVELSEIEHRLAEHPEVRAAIVDAAPRGARGRKLCAYVVASLPSPDASYHLRLRAYLSRHLPAWMVPSRFITLERLPLTPMGKVDRNALPPLMDQRGEVGEFEEPANEAERKLATLFGDLLGIARVGATDDFFALGGDSLLAVEASFRIHNHFGVALPGPALFEAPTPRTLAATIEHAAQDDMIEPWTGEAAPLLDTQRRLWFIHRMDPSGVEYNVSLVVHLTGPLNFAALSESLRLVVERQQALQTVYGEEDGTPQQRCRPYAPALPVVSLAHLEPGQRGVESDSLARDFFRRPFDLREGPVLRATCLDCGEDTYRLLLSIHHIAIDGWSIRVLHRDLVALYAKTAGHPFELPHLARSTLDYAAWRRRQLDGDRSASLVSWWKTALDGRPRPAALPLDDAPPARSSLAGSSGARSSPAGPSGARSSLAGSSGARSSPAGPSGARPSLAGTVFPLRFHANLTASLGALARAEGATLFEVLLAAFARVIALESGQSDLLMGTVVAARDRPELENLVGFFSNTLPIRIRAGSCTTFRSLLVESRSAARGARSHQALPYERLLEALAVERNADGQSLSRICFIFQPPPSPPQQAEGLRFVVEEVDNGTAPFDLTLQLWRVGGELRGNFLYRTERFNERTIESLAESLGESLRHAVENVDRVLPPLSRGPCAKLTTELGRDPRVLDAAVVVRMLSNGEAERVAAVVTRNTLDGSRSLRPRSGTLHRIVRVSRIPRDDDGRVDAPALLDGVDSTQIAAPVVGRIHIESLGRFEDASGAPETGGPAPGDCAFADSSESKEALLVGPPLHLKADDPRTLAELLDRVAREAPTQSITTIGSDDRERTLTYAELRERARSFAAGLCGRGVRPGAVVMLQVDNNEDLLVALWGAFTGGYVAMNMAVPLAYEPEIGAADRLRGVWEVLHQPPVIVSERLREPLARFVPRMELHVVETVRGTNLMPPAIDAGDRALCLLTSGSTGVPKVVQHTHATVCSFLTGYANALGFSARDVFLNCLGLDHVAPLYMTHLIAMWCRARSVNAPYAAFLRSPRRFLEWADRHGATSTFFANFAYGLIADAAVETRGGWDLSSLRAALNAGEHVIASTCQRFVEALAPYGLPAEAMRPCWGMSETSSATVVAPPLRRGAIDPEARFVSAGFPTPGFSARIVGDDRRVQRYGQVGRLQVRGPQITVGYFERPDANQEAFVGEGWFDTGDLAFIDDAGVTLTGRAKEVIIINGANYHAHEIEAAVQSVEGVLPSFAAAFAVRRPGDETDRIAVAYAREEGREPREQLKKIRASVASRVGVAPTWVLPVDRAQIPKTEIGKIQRTKLRSAFERGDLDELRRSTDLMEENDRTMPAWFFARTWRRANPRSGERPERILALGRRGQLSAEVADALGAALVILDDGLSLESSAERIVAAVSAEDDSPDHHVAIVDLLALDRGTPAAPVRILAAARALSRKPNLRVGYFWVAPRTCAVHEGVAGGLALTLPHELAHVSSRIVEVENGACAEEIAPYIRSELSEPTTNSASAWRDGDRFESHLIASRFEGGTTPPFEAGQLLVVTGGAGGIGRLLCADLLARGYGPILLVGRRAESVLSGESRELIARHSDRLEYRQVDLTDGDAFERAVSAAEGGRGSSLGAVFHLAASMEQALLVDETAIGVQAVVAGRVAGLGNCAETAARRAAALVDFSSVNGIYGGFGASAYAAASTASLRIGQRLREGGQGVWSLAWSRWDATGLGAAQPAELAARRGYLSIPPQHGLRSMWACLAQPAGEWLIGLDPSHPEVLRWRVDVPARRVDDGPPSSPHGSSMVEHELGDVGRRIASIWAEVLEVPHVGPLDNFFDLGGHSLLLFNVQEKLQDAFDREIQPMDLFRFPTVHALERHLDGDIRSPARESTARAHGRRQRQAQPDRRHRSARSS